MAAAVVLFVEVDGIVHSQLTHVLREHGTIDLQEEMVVVAHQTVVVDPYSELTGIGTHQLDEVFIVLGLYEDGTTLHTPVEDMVIPGNFDTGFSGHGSSPGWIREV